MIIVLALVLIVGAVVIWGYRDYRAWIAIGKGGLPANLGGWLTTTRLRLRKRDPFTTALYAQTGPQNISHLDDLPARNGPRPQIAPWPIPHRQTDQFIGTAMRRELDAVFDQTVQRYSDTVDYKLSFFERHNPAITMKDPDGCHPHAGFGQGETAHIHPGDGSMHMIFSQSDAAKVIDAGWGERHPVAGITGLLPDTYVYVYPPRDAAELRVVEKLVEAAILHMQDAPGVAPAG